MMATNDQVKAMFDGLSFEYDTFMVSINTRTKSYTIKEIESLLLA